MLHQFGNNSTSFSIFFPISGSREAMEEGSYTSSSSYANPSSVDCTLSLGPPSSSGGAPERSTAPGFCWDIVSQSKATAHHPSVAAAAASRVPPPAASNNVASNNMGGGDPLLLARRCANCDTTSTPLWRNGPRGPKSLCNACGIRYKKEERRAAASTAAPSPAAGNEAIAYTTYQRRQQQQQQQQQNSSWGCYNSNSSTAANSGRDDDVDQVPYLSWRLNVVPQPTTLFQYQ